MKWSAVTVVAGAALASAAAWTHEEYASGEVMEFMMSSKEAAWAKARAAGKYDQERWKGFEEKRPNKGKIPCKDGVAVAVPGDADQTYKCKNIVSRLFLPIGDYS